MLPRGGGTSAQCGYGASFGSACTGTCQELPGHAGKRSTLQGNARSCGQAGAKSKTPERRGADSRQLQGHHHSVVIREAFLDGADDPLVLHGLQVPHVDPINAPGIATGLHLSDSQGP
eukprot:UN2658